MKLAITSTGPTLDSNMDPRFGRCAYFLIVDSDTLECEAIENPNVSLGQGAGIQSAQLLSGKGVHALLTGQCGPNAHETLSAAGINAILGCSGLVRDAVQRYRSGQLTASAGPNSAAHAGLEAPQPVPNDPAAPARQAPPPGRGFGRGRGGGGGGGGGGGSRRQRQCLGGGSGSGSGSGGGGGRG